jgi:hypothetical protein
MITVNLKLKGADDYLAALKRHPEKVGRTTESLLRQEARALATNLAAVTLPLGMGENKASNLKARIEADVSRLFPTTDSAWQVYELIKQSSPKHAAAYWQAYKSSDERAMLNILRRAKVPRGLNPGDHQSQRKGGKVPGNAAPISLAPPGRRAAYIRRRQKKAGLAKAGWYAAATALGGRVRTRSARTGKSVQRFPKYVRTLGKTPGIGGANFLGGPRARARIWNTVSYIGSALPDTLYYQALDRAQLDFVRALNRSVAYLNQNKFNKSRAA